MAKAVRRMLRRSSYEQLSMAAVAAEAKVSRAALYRRWPNKGRLCFDLLYGNNDGEMFQPTSDWRADLRAVVRLLAANFSDKAARRAIPGLLSTFADDPALAKHVRDQLLSPGYMAIAFQLERGSAAGDITCDNPTLASDMFFGCVFVRAGILNRPIDDAFADEMVDMLIEGMTP